MTVNKIQNGTVDTSDQKQCENVDQRAVNDTPMLITLQNIKTVACTKRHYYTMFLFHQLRDV